MSERYSNKKIKRCPNTISTDCVEWQAGAFPCLDICNGDILSEAQFNIATELCRLIGEMDVSSVTIPPCLGEAWNTNDPTVLNFIQFLLDSDQILCERITSLEDNQFTLATEFSVDFSECCASECEVAASLTLQENFQEVLKCLCRQQARIIALETLIGDTSILGGKTICQYINDVKVTANQADTNASDWIIKKPCIILNTGC
jgi:hypothetical protein